LEDPSYSTYTTIDFEDDQSSNSGTGLNPDGTQANIGVYGGPYAWGEWIMGYSLFSVEGIIKTIDGSVLTETGLSEPLSKNDFETHGVFLNDLSEEDWGVLPDQFEIITWTDIITDETTQEMLVELTVEENKPINWLPQPVAISTWTDSTDPLELEMTYNAYSKITYQVSTDNETWWGFNSTTAQFEENYEMSQSELEGITETQFRNWVGDSIYKFDFYYKINLESDNPDNLPTVSSFETTFKPNQGPVINNFNITPDEIHNNHVEVTGDLVDLENDSIEYRVLIQKVSESSFTEVNAWTPKPNGSSFFRAYDKSYFELGENQIKVETRDQRGDLGAEMTGNIVLTNTAPTVNYSFNEFKVTGEIGDIDSDKIRYRVKINGSPFLDWTNWLETPTGFLVEWKSDDVRLGELNVIQLEIEDEFNAITTESFEVMGKYNGLLFVDENGNYYMSDQGVELKKLDIPQIIAGQNSEPKKVTLLNQTGSSLESVNIAADNGDLPDTANVYVDLSDTAFTPKALIELNEIMNHGDSKDFYVSIQTQMGKGKLGANFHIKTEGSIIV
jgi:hypothetical protein